MTFEMGSIYVVLVDCKCGYEGCNGKVLASDECYSTQKVANDVASALGAWGCDLKELPVCSSDEGVRRCIALSKLTTEEKKLLGL